MTFFTVWQACERGADTISVGNPSGTVPAFCDVLRPEDIVTLLLLLASIIFLVWAFNKENKKISRARQESYNKLDRLIKAEIEKTRTLERAARFGSLSQGLFHDLMSPLSAISLSVEKLHNISPNVNLATNTDLKKLLKELLRPRGECKISSPASGLR